jgi:ATP-dependent Zn protease
MPKKFCYYGHMMKIISALLLTSILYIIGTGKTLLARAVASQLDANFLKVVSSAIVDKYIGNIYILLCLV